MLCKQGVGGSSPPTSTNPFGCNLMEPGGCRRRYFAAAFELAQGLPNVMNDLIVGQRFQKRDQVGSVQGRQLEATN